MGSTNNEYIRKARKNRKIKKCILLSVFCILCGIVVITYTDIFHIKNVVLVNQSLVTEDYVSNKAEELKGLNLVFISKSKINSIFNDNYYVDSVEVKKVYPNTIELSVTEKTALFYEKDGSLYNILSDDMIYIEKTDILKSENMIEIKGVNFAGKGIGQNISSSEREKEVLKNIYSVQEFLKEQFRNVKVTSIDISDLSDIRCYFNNIEVYLGSDEDIIKKVKTAALIYDKGIVKKYIKVNFNGSPDFE